MPKYQRAWSGLYVLGIGFLWLSRHVGVAASGLASTPGFLIIALGFAVFLAGMIAERRDWERQQEKSDEDHSHTA
jgi:apolipoprotein N-acyltransferase